MSERIERFQQLRVYQHSCDLDLAIFEVSKRWPREELYSLIDQVRRSSRSVGANLAEAWAKRCYPAHFVSKLTDADGELDETRHWISRAMAYGYLTNEEARAFEQQCDQIGRELGRMITHPEGFVGQ